MPKNIKKFKKYIMCVLIAVFLIVPSILLAESEYRSQNINKQPFCLLLNSGLLDCQSATIKYIIWTEDKSELPLIEKALKQTEISWQKNILQDYSKNNAFEYIAEFDITKQKESKAWEDYMILKNKIATPKVRIYFEERANSYLNIDLYFKQNNVNTQEKAKTSNIISLTGYYSGFRENVKLGWKIVNIQVAAKEENNTNEGKTVLALPVLFDEF